MTSRMRTKHNVHEAFCGALSIAVTLILCTTVFAYPSTVSASRNLQQCDENPFDSSSSATSGYSQWKSTIQPSQYPNDLFIPSKSNPCHGIAFHWKIDQDSSKIHIAVAAKANGWASIGFSETGGMRGADIVYYEAVTGELVDAHVGDEYARPAPDKLQDWTLTNDVVTDDGFIIFEAMRALFTNAGNEDREIVDDSSIYVHDHIIIGAWGDSDELSFHGPSVVHETIQLFSSDNIEAGEGLAIFEKEMDQRADGFADLKLYNYSIPLDETTYEYQCFTVDKLVDLGLYKDSNSSTYIIGFQFLIDPSAVKYIHHIVLYGHSTLLNNGTKCSYRTMKFLALWTPGIDFMLFPEGLGLKIGDVPDSFNSLTMQYHIDNIDSDENKFDNGSGVRIFHSDKPVQHEVGMVSMGDTQLDLYGYPVGLGKSKHQFTCPTECTNNSLFTDDVTVIMEAHHMHTAGKRLVSELVRGDEVVNVASVDYWDFKQNGAIPVRQQPYTLRRGDSYRTTCYFEAKENITFGLQSSDEMCMTFMYYYPKQPMFINCSPESFIPSCQSSYETISLDSDSNFDRVVTDTSSLLATKDDVISSATTSSLVISSATILYAVMTLLM